MTALIQHICDLAEPARPARYKAYLSTLEAAALKQKLADLLLDDSKARTEPVRFWRVSPKPATAPGTVDRRELITI
jgi:hypothetical protein